MARVCILPECDVVPDDRRHLMCPDHWRHVPAPLRRELLGTRSVLEEKMAKAIEHVRKGVIVDEHVARVNRAR